MILFFADGRLGNQLFQYAFLGTLRRGSERIVTSGFEEFLEIFEAPPRLYNLNRRNRYLRAFVYRVLVPKLLEPFAKRRIVTSFKQQKVASAGYEIATGAVTQTVGFFERCIYVRLGFFQSEALFDEQVAKSLSIRPKYAEAAERFLADVPAACHKVFVHIRRGDYLEWSVLGEKDPTLPLSYYHDRIHWFVKNRPGSFFIFLSDDPEFVADEFAEVADKKISRDNPVGTDLAVMTQCDSGIVSNSSLAWWGGYLMKKRDTVFAPKFWLGFKRHIWYPDGIRPSFARDVEVAL